MKKFAINALGGALFIMAFFTIVGCTISALIWLGVMLFGTPIGAFIGFVLGISVLFGVAMAADEQMKDEKSEK